MPIVWYPIDFSTMSAYYAILSIPDFLLALRGVESRLG